MDKPRPMTQEEFNEANDPGPDWFKTGSRQAGKSRRLRTLQDIVADMATRFSPEPGREPEHFELEYNPPRLALEASSSDGTGYDPPRLTGAVHVVSPDGAYQLLAVDEAADWIPREPTAAVFSKPAPAPVHPDFTERGVELPLGFVPHKLENRTTRLAATATWKPPKIQGEPYWSEPLPAEHFESFHLGQVGNTGDGERVRVTAIDREGMRVYFEPLAEKVPSRRELVKQKQKQRRGKLDPSLRRLQLVAAERKAKK